MKTTNLLLLFLLICLNPVVNLAQDQDILWFNQVDESNNLSSGKYNYYTYQDSEGFVWMSSVNGLNRFDGQRVKQYHVNPNDTTSFRLADEIIQSTFFENSDQNLWFATYHGINSYDRTKDSFRHYTISNSQGDTISENYKAFHLERDSFLWIHADFSIYRMNIKNPSQVDSIGYSKYVHNFIKKDALGFITHIISLDNKNKGINFFELENNRIKEKKNRFFSIPLKDKKGKIINDTLSFRQALFENPTRVWLTSNRGLLKWDPIKDSFELVQRMDNTYSSVVDLDSTNVLVSYANNQLYKVNKKTNDLTPYLLQSVENPLSPFNFEIRHLTIDRAKNLWMTVHPHGVIFAHPNKTKFQSISKNVFPPLSPDFKFESFIEKKDGTIWAVHNKGIFVFNQKRQLIRSFEAPDIYPSTTYINHAIQDQSGIIWIAINDGLAFLEPGKNKFQFIETTNKLEFLYLYQLRDGKLLGSTLNQGVHEISSTNNVWEIKNYITSKKSFTTIYEDQLGQIYFCEENSSLHIYTSETDSITKETEIETRSAVNAFYEATDGKTLWIGTSLGLASIEKDSLNKKINYLNPKNNFPSNNILGINPKSRNELWLSTDKGLVLYNIQKNEIKTFSIEEGVLSNQFDEYSFIKLKNKDIWFGGSNGITIIPEKSILPIIANPKIVFTTIDVSGVDPKNLKCDTTHASNINQLKKIKLDYTQNSITFKFNVTDYSAPNSTTVKYKLEGFNDNWISNKKGEQGFVQYPKLNPGNYQFRVQGADSEGKWSAKRTINIEITPPFWATWWFRTLAVIAILGLILLLVKLRINQIRKTSDLKTKIAENKMAALVAQMNPHFIFNSLQSINSYILKNDKQQASEYLGRFSKLMRMILENSRHSTHSLQQEIDLLSLYMKVEAQRFKTPFKHDIIIDESIDPYETLIPAMMLQPFIENAIWHGISHKKEDGSIKVDITSKNDLLKCTVEDNGVGRKKAAEISIQKRKSHTSRATEIITDRLALLFPYDRDRCSIEYIDLIDKDQNPAGTRVEIFLPLIDDI